MTCGRCHAVPAVVHVTVRRGEAGYATDHFCEPCFRLSCEGRPGDSAHRRPDGPTIRHGEFCEHLSTFLRGKATGLTDREIVEVVESIAREVERWEGPR
jgi:hypothetical protein